MNPLTRNFISTAFFASSETVKNLSRTGQLTLKSLIERTKKGWYTITYITASIDYKQSTLIIVETPETCRNRVSGNTNG